MVKLAASGLLKLPAPLKTGHLSVVQPWFSSFEPGALRFSMFEIAVDLLEEG